MLTHPCGRVVCVDSAYDVDERNSNTDVVVTGSYTGVLCARFVSIHRPKGAIGVDCAIGPEGASIAGLWFYEALDLPAVAADVMSVELGNGVDVYKSGIVSRLNEPARRCEVRPGMAVAEAAERLLTQGGQEGVPPAEVTHRKAVYESDDGDIVCSDSIAFALPVDRDRNVLCTGGHTGRSAVPYLRKAHPKGFICSDGGRGRGDSGIMALDVVAADGLAGATVDARTARMGDGISTYEDGVVSAVNQPAERRGVRVGMAAREAAMHLLLGLRADE